MKTIGIVSLLVVAFLAAIFVFTPKHPASPPYDVYIGPPTDVSMFTQSGGWVTVVNKTPVSNYNSVFQPGDPCVVSYDGDFREVGHQGVWAIISYQVLGRTSKPAGTQCGDGTYFTVTEPALAKLYKNQTAFRKKMASIHLFVRNHEDDPGKRLVRNPWPGSAFTWVEVVNADGTTSASDYFGFSDHCGIDRRRLKLSVLAIRDSDQAHLMRYDGPDGVGTECAHGTLFIAYPDHGLLLPEGLY